jgi:ABC-type polysaccharide/polyol phosphate transport system ATPase subunit
MEKNQEPLPEDIAVEVKDVVVSFRSYKERPSTLKESVLQFAKTGKLNTFSTFNALDGVTFSIPRGTVFGIIGSNGAGKSTLLKTIAGVIPPTQGSIRINGKLDSFIQLGAGFDPELNAIENIYLNCTLHQMKVSVIKERIPHILDFAELHKFAKTPIKYYSSGMSARLGFAVAIEREPDVLLVDEVLAVGDKRFREKCDRVLESYLEKKKTIVMVSHGLDQIATLADNALLLSKGKVDFLGNPREAVARYNSSDYVTALEEDEELR